jgi:hypothetical protein
MNGSLTNRRIVSVRSLTQAELDQLEWEQQTFNEIVGVELDDGSLLIPSQDFEGNGPGVLFQLAGNKIYAHAIARKGSIA